MYCKQVNIKQTMKIVFKIVFIFKRILSGIFLRTFNILYLKDTFINILSSLTAVQAEKLRMQQLNLATGQEKLYEIQ